MRYLLKIFIHTLLILISIDARAQHQAFFLEPYHQARFVEGLQFGTTFSDTAGRVSVLSATAVHPIYLLADLRLTNPLGTGRLHIYQPTLGLAHIPFSLGTFNLGWNVQLHGLNSFAVTAVLGLNPRVFTFNIGYGAEWEKRSTQSPQSVHHAYFLNLGFNIHHFRLEMETEGTFSGKPRLQYSWVKRNRKWHFGLSYEAFSNFYLNASIFDARGERERWIGFSYIFSSLSK